MNGFIPCREKRGSEWVDQCGSPLPLVVPKLSLDFRRFRSRSGVTQTPRKPAAAIAGGMQAVNGDWWHIGEHVADDSGMFRQ
jgi:hypothetical protein